MEQAVDQQDNNDNTNILNQEINILEPNAEHSLAESFLNQTLNQLSEEKTDDLKEELEKHSPAEIANLLEGLTAPERQAVAESIVPEMIPDVLSEMRQPERSLVAESLDIEVLTASVNTLAEPHAVELLDSLPESLADEIRESLDPKERQRLEATLEWPEGTAGRLMHIDAVSVRADVSLAIVQRYLRLRKTVPSNTDALIVVNREGVYLGKMDYTAILTNPPEVHVETVMDSQAIAVNAMVSEEEVVKLFEHRGLISVAVVDDNGLLIGRIEVDDIVDIIRRTADQQMLHMSNLHEEDDTFGPIWPSAKKRAVWLGLNLLTAFLASSVIGLFQNALDKIVALAVLMPIVSSMGGITGSQTLALVIRGLSLGTISSGNARSLAVKELSIGVLNGLLWAMIVAGVTTLWFKDYTLGWIIAIAMVINMAIAALSGWALPLILTRYGQDPAISGSVLLTTVTDIVGFMSFLGLATLLLL
ncbi:MAG: magnesium transporter [Magnetococcales bacterium]|nr:magnesium transporter [Magnetococcales bacterium]